MEFIQRYYDAYYTHPEFRGYAGDVVPNSSEPRVGASVLTNEPTGHAAIIVAIYEGSLVLAESNYYGDERVSVGRKIQIDDPRIRGYFDFNK